MDQHRVSELNRAATYGKLYDVKRLLHDCSISLDGQDEDGRTALYLAARLGHSTILGLLIEAPARLDVQDVRGRTALHEACWRNHEESVRLLTKSQADVSLRTAVGRSPLHIASARGHLECAHYLLGARADPNSKDENGWSATHHAAINGHIDVLRLLLAASADPNQQTCTGESPVHLAAVRGRSEAMSFLVSGGADPNSPDSNGSTPLHLAAIVGHEDTVLRLLQLGCDQGLMNAAGLSAAAAACCFGHISILMMMLRQTPINGLSLSDQLQLPECTEKTLQALRKIDKKIELENPGEIESPEILQSTSLHDEMRQAGFQQHRAAIQSALADVLQDIMRRRWNENLVNIVGSYSDGWGNSLASLNGVTDSDADIDETVILSDQEFHMQGHDQQICRCEYVSAEERVHYEDGHVLYPGSASTPAKACQGSPLKPAVDVIFAYRCCAYPRIDVLIEGCKTEILPEVLSSLRGELTKSPCHLVSAAPPGEGGQKLRVSTSFLERELMRSLTDVQGQVFVLLKYLVKRTNFNLGLKTYHAKTMIFYLLDETPSCMWQPCSIMSLTRRALQILLNGLQNSRPDSHECMRHFFLRDAIVYLKKNVSKKADVVKAVKKMMEQLPILILEFKQQLRPLSNGEVFRFHPFLILPYTQVKPVPESGELPYHSVSDAVRSALLGLTDANPGSCESLLNSIRRIGDFAATARHCLMGLTYLNYGMKDEAIVILRDGMTFQVSKGVPCPGRMTSGKEAKDYVWRHLNSTDSIWKFSLRFEERVPSLEILPESIRNCFPGRMQFAEIRFMNMRALLRCLCLHLGVADETHHRAWFEDVLQDEEPDMQELLMVLEFCRDKDLLVSLIQRHRQRICNTDEVWQKLERLVSDDVCLNASFFKGGEWQSG